MNATKRVRKLRVNTIILLILLVVTSVVAGTALTVNLDLQNRVQTIENRLEMLANSSLTGFSVPCNYIVSIVGSYCRLQNGADGRLVYYSTNVSRAFLYAIGNCTSGGAIYVEAGNYSFDTTLTISQPIKLVGAGKLATVLVFMGTEGTNAITIDAAGPANGWGVYLADFQLKPQTQAGSGSGIFINSIKGYGVTIERLRIGTIYNYDDGFGAYGVWANASSFLRIRDCEIGGSVRSGIIATRVGNEEPNVLLIDGTQCCYNNEYGIWVDGANGVTVTGGYLGYNKLAGLSTGTNSCSINMQGTYIEQGASCMDGIELCSGTGHRIYPAIDYVHASSTGYPICLSSTYNVHIGGHIVKGSGLNGQIAVRVNSTCQDTYIEGQIGENNSDPFTLVDDKGLRTIFDFGHTVIDWQDSPVGWIVSSIYNGSGTSSNQNPFLLGVATQTTQNTSAAKYVLMIDGLTYGGSNEMDFNKYIEWDIDVQRVTSLDSAVAWLKLSLDNTTNDLAAEGFAWEIRNLAVYGEAHNGTSLETVNLSTTLNAGAIYKFTIRFYPGNWVDYFINDVWMGRITATLPAGLGSAPYFLMSIYNANTTTNVILRCGMMGFKAGA